MKKSLLIPKIIISILLFLVFITIGTFAYYEYYGKYKTVLNVNGTIKLDAFDVLYADLREDPSYGITPENPYVVDNVARLQNLILLNNSGKLKQYKVKYGVDRLYFCLEFDEQDIPQILNLENSGVFNSIGNNEYPFEDELSGIVYGYELTEGNIVYLSGCLPKVNISIENDNVYVNGVLDDTLDPNDYSNGIYLKLEKQYDETLFDPLDPRSIVFKDSSTTEYISTNSVTEINQIIANETIIATTEQVDIGFINKIATDGYVHDIILYGTTIICNEEEDYAVHNFLTEFFKTITGHNFNDADYHSDERHIGIFAGHIDGSASNISIAGKSNINIATKDVNYFSNYVTVGYIYGGAYIGGVAFDDLTLDSFLDGGNVNGCLFADDIYASVDLEEDSSINHS